jgi:hypothetical protein
LVGGGYDFGASDDGECILRRTDGTTFSPTFSHNVLTWGARTCGTDTTARALLVDPGTIMFARLSNQAAAAESNADVNLNLASSAEPGITHGGESTYCGPGKIVSRDLNGRARPLGTPCDVGADQAG